MSVVARVAARRVPGLLAGLLSGLLSGLIALPLQAAPRVPAPFLWEVHAGATTHYLLGSVHLLPKAAHPLPAALEASYAQAHALVFESDLAALEDPQLQQQLLDGARRTPLHEQVPAAMLDRVHAQARRYGLPETACDAVAAWFCAMTLEVFAFREQGFDGALGLDQSFYERARRDHKAVAWFEAPQDHLRLFAGMDAALGREFLAATLDDSDDADAQLAALLAAWQRGDTQFVAELAAAMHQAQPALYERLLAARNRAWLPQLVARLGRAEPQLIVVGAAHLVGPDGLVAMLRTRGIDVRPYAAVAEPGVGATPAR